MIEVNCQVGLDTPQMVAVAPGSIAARLSAGRLDGREVIARDRHGVTVEFVHQNVTATLPKGVAINIFRVVQKALSNAVTHSGAARRHVLARNR